MALDYVFHCRILYTWLYIKDSNSFNLVEFFETSDHTDDSREDETCQQFKNHFIKTREISPNKYTGCGNITSCFLKAIKQVS